MKKNIKKNIFINKVATPIIARRFDGSPSCATKGRWYPPKYKVDITADATNILMYSENK